MDDEEFYSSPTTRLGALQLGLGRGATRATADPATASEDVLSCLRRDHRWWWIVDDRPVYLARLVRDLEVPITRVLAVLDETPPEDDDNGADLTSEVLEVLGRAGHEEAVEGLHRRIGDGPQGLEALETVPERLEGPEPPDVPQLAEARRWVATPDHPRYWPAAFVLAEEGDAPDVPALLEAMSRVHTRAKGFNWCHLGLIEGLPRIGGDEAARIVPRLRRLWFTPHIYERAAVLKALMTLAPADEHSRRLFEGLWDCEADIRELASAHVGLTDRTRERLAYLRDDRMETPEVRVAAARRLG